MAPASPHGAGGDLTQWLRDNGLRHLVPIFQQHEIDTLDDALTLTEEELVEMELSTVDRSAFLGAVSSREAGAPSEVDRWLESEGLGKHAGVFQQHEIYTLEAVKTLEYNDLKEMFKTIGPRKLVVSAVDKLKQAGGSHASLATAVSEPPLDDMAQAASSPPRRYTPPPARKSPTPPRTPRTAQGSPPPQPPAAEAVAYYQDGRNGEGGWQHGWSRPQQPGRPTDYDWRERSPCRAREFDGFDEGGKKDKSADWPKPVLREKKKELCRDHQRGQCQRGPRCPYAHGWEGLTGLSPPPRIARIQPQPTIFQSASSSVQDVQPPPRRVRRKTPPKTTGPAAGDKMHVDPAPESATAVKIRELEEQVRRMMASKEKTAESQVQKLQAELKRKEEERDEEIRRACEKALRTKTEDRERKHKMRIDDIASTYVATSDHKAVRRIMGKIGDMGNVVDVVFCIDGTGSMQPHIESVRSNIVDLAADLIAACQLKSRVGIVVYRDYADGHRRFETYNFMEPVEVQDTLGKVVAMGGADAAEDCIGGLEKVTQLDWQAPARVCIWIADAPTHGSRFHDGAHDSYKEGDPDGRTPEKVLSIFNDKNIELIFLKINPSTDKMVRVFSEVLAGFQRELQMYPMADKHGLRSVLKESITASVSRTASRSGPVRATRKHFTLRPDFAWAPGHICWGPKEKATVYQLEAFEAKDVDSIIEVVVDGPHISDKPAKVCMTKDPAFKGELRLAYPCRMDGDWLWSSDKHLIAKESQYAAGKYNSKEFNLKEASIQLVACKFAQEWNKVFSDIEISFVSVRVIALQDRPRDHKYFQIEEYLPGKYHKWNNNNGYVSDVEAHPAMQTFSHWTYVHSKGLALVVDLQGVFTEKTSWRGKPKYTLTDPAIHTGDPEKTMPSQTNLGRDGMARFFASHRCNDLCRHLKLPLPDGMSRATKEDVTRAAAASPDDAVSSWRPSMG
eukprot:TRINITY_DN683_c0_g1_i12.p1 TRINITY_DN683_c0_g1~~TRINITY_DN683_c0_g1_i12.p1  ORF type:complete len:960 (+),score=263.96 TRINITY_DN683_c0_g1_i12:98-2977(+)